MQIFLYKEDFFYKKILLSSKESIQEIIKDKNKFYRKKKIPKKKGYRTLCCLEKDSSLYKVQQSIRKNFLNKISIPDYVYGFVPKNSYKDFLVSHTGKKYYLRLDIQNFFQSIDTKVLKEVFLYYFRLKDNNEETLNNFIELVTLEDKVPQGAVTSPVISNIIFRRLDLRIYNYCKKFNITYTRYADDLLFSSDNLYIHKEFFIKKIQYIVSTMGFEINKYKSRYDKDFISLNGFVIEENIRLSRKKMKNLSGILFIVEKHRNRFNIGDVLAEIQSLGHNKQIDSKGSLIHHLAGYRAFLIQFINKEQETDLGNKKIFRYIERIENTILFLHSL
ncbi:reverse transcriptase family protein [Bacillus wiedmannii]|uniref:reverse transcriptase family protein n=1 Tax=Bacillus wiedmannii TaxID=1890302 RepID=UPI0030EBFD6D